MAIYSKWFEIRAFHPGSKRLVPLGYEDIGCVGHKDFDDSIERIKLRFPTQIITVWHLTTDEAYIKGLSTYGY